MATDKKTIKSYNRYAKKWAALMRSGNNVAHDYLEKPAMYKKLPSLKGKKVLCVGCGTGEECKYLKSKGAKVVGIDISKELIKIAEDSYPDIEFKVMDMEKINFSKNSFDYIYSSLVLHYLKNWSKVLKGIYRVLKPNGIFLFSTHHPIRWGAEFKRGKIKDSYLLGYITDKQKNSVKIYGDYFTTRKVTDVWFGDFKVSFYHKPLQAIIKEIFDAGFKISDFIEPKPLIGMKKKKRRSWQSYSKIPMFIIFELKK